LNGCTTVDVAGNGTSFILIEPETSSLNANKGINDTKFKIIMIPPLQRKYSKFYNRTMMMTRRRKKNKSTNIPKPT